MHQKGYSLLAQQMSSDTKRLPKPKGSTPFGAHARPHGRARRVPPYQLSLTRGGIEAGCQPRHRRLGATMQPPSFWSRRADIAACMPEPGSSSLQNSQVAAAGRPSGPPASASWEFSPGKPPASDSWVPVQAQGRPPCERHASTPNLPNTRPVPAMCALKRLPSSSL